MFNLFKKKEPSLKITDKIWMTSASKLKSIAEEMKKNNALVFICWFDETFHQLESHFTGDTTGSIRLLRSREAVTAHLPGTTIIFAEHYPLREKEITLFQKLGLQEVQIWSALDEPLFKHFGGDRIIQLMKQMGMKEDQAMEHTMISDAIRNAQQKIEKKVQVEQSAHSQKDWIEKNLI
jgi:hypothetical protein